MYNLDDIQNLITHTQQLTLLYVEDNSEARETTLLLFEEFFKNIIIATNGLEGIELFKKNKIDLIITDINMPKLNGLEMIKEIKNIDEDVLIFVLSAYNESGYFMDSIKLGVEGYLLKPIETEHFLKHLKKVITKLDLIEEAKTTLHFLQEYEDLTNSSAIVSKADTNGNITFVNDKFCNITGYKREEIIGQNHNFLKHPDVPAEFFFEIFDTISNKKEIWNGILKIISKDTKSINLDTTIKPILDDNGEVIEYISMSRDVTDIINPKKQLNDTIKTLQKPLVIYMKIEEYDILEELFDTDTIEKVQEKIAKYLQTSMQDICYFDKVFQLGNGEYALAQEEDYCFNNSHKIFIHKLQLFQNKVRNDKIDIGAIDYDINLLISISYSCEQVLESAMLGIKKLLQSKKNFIIANNLAQEKREIAQANIKTINMIKKAIQEKKVISYFQPILNNETLEIEKYESLARLVNEDGEVLTPYYFLEVAKKSKYYPLITNIVLEHSFNALINTDKEISINLSAIDIEQKSTRDTIFTLLHQYKENSHRVIFELLEDETVKNFDILKEFISDVKKLGVKIAIDDFGSGYSNFERLVYFSPDILKIDGAIIRDIKNNDYSRAVVKTIIAFAQEQNIKTVAEYVETEEIFNILKELGVDYSQGYYFGKPEDINIKKS